MDKNTSQEREIATRLPSRGSVTALQQNRKINIDIDRVDWREGDGRGSERDAGGRDSRVRFCGEKHVVCLKRKSCPSINRKHVS
ncbi:hypothetical protein GWI33_006449 [Rhynchophorus ferrugineus]|uniref:Uncharacterized protein n=1 Tax=Rhynchophorus ferrugineus TaxID=354439 RepID=A0A834MFG4_RHYFE|nr:hypothetical protein GWI33_006449 [Rhynchophorus ferrugineus]